MTDEPSPMRETERFSPAQCRAARAYLSLPIDDLARRAGLEIEAITLYEIEDGDLSDEELKRLGKAFNILGMIAKAHNGFGEGVRFVRSMVTPNRRTAFARVDGGGLPWYAPFSQEPSEADHGGA